jgi:diguanylate cyclase (GGDEF)-like protein
LTGLVNNRGMLRHLERLMFTHGRGKGEFSVVMLDVDGFKEVNDKLGHLRGDDLLREIGRLVSHVSRNDDIPCRYAGDEFVLLLPHANREQAEEVAARLRETMDNIRNVGGSVRIGASVGVATYPEDGDHGRALIQAADARMYEDKFRRRQRSRILPAEEPAAEELVA